MPPRKSFLFAISPRGSISIVNDDNYNRLNRIIRRIIIHKAIPTAIICPFAWLFAFKEHFPSPISAEAFVCICCDT